MSPLIAFAPTTSFFTPDFLFGCLHARLSMMFAFLIYVQLKLTLSNSFLSWLVHQYLFLKRDLTMVALLPKPMKNLNVEYPSPRAVVVCFATSTNGEDSFFGTTLFAVSNFTAAGVLVYYSSKLSVSISSTFFFNGDLVGNDISSITFLGDKGYS